MANVCVAEQSRSEEERVGALVVDEHVAFLAGFSHLADLARPTVGVHVCAASVASLADSVALCSQRTSLPLACAISHPSLAQAGCINVLLASRDAHLQPHSHSQVLVCVCSPLHIPAAIAHSLGCTVVGVAMSSKRLCDLAISELLWFMPRRCICYSPVYSPNDLLRCSHSANHDCALLCSTADDNKAPAIDALLHKATDGLEGLDSHGQAIWDSHYSAIIACAEQMHIACIEPLTSVSCVATRTEMCCALSEASSFCPDQLHIPEWQHVSASSSASMLKEVLKIGMHPPFMVKPELACGAGWAHRMLLVLRPWLLSENDFNGLGDNAIVQRFVNHSGLLHKVYKMGQGLVTATKPSLPDVEEALEQWHSAAALRFYSLKELSIHEQRHQTQHMNANTRTLANIAGAVEASLSMAIFGLDVVVERETGRHFAIDLNYFPSCKAVSRQASSELADYVRKRVQPNAHERHFLIHMAEANKQQHCAIGCMCDNSSSKGQWHAMQNSATTA